MVVGSPTWARTRDLRINSPSLYRLSYRGIVVPAYAWVAIWESGILPAETVSRHCTPSMNHWWRNAGKQAQLITLAIASATYPILREFIAATHIRPESSA